MNGRILQRSELDSLILKLPRVQDRGTLWVHEYEIQRKLTETEIALRMAQRRIEELEALVPAVETVEVPAVTATPAVVGRIVAWLRSGPGNGDTVRAKHAQKIAGLIESGAYDTGVSE